MSQNIGPPLTLFQSGYDLLTAGETIAFALSPIPLEPFKAGIQRVGLPLATTAIATQIPGVGDLISTATHFGGDVLSNVAVGWAGDALNQFGQHLTANLQAAAQAAPKQDVSMWQRPWQQLNAGALEAQLSAAQWIGSATKPMVLGAAGVATQIMGQLTTSATIGRALIKGGELAMRQAIKEGQQAIVRSQAWLDSTLDQLNQTYGIDKKIAQIQSAFEEVKTIAGLKSTEQIVTETQAWLGKTWKQLDQEYKITNKASELRSDLGTRLVDVQSRTVAEINTRAKSWASMAWNQINQQFGIEKQFLQIQNALGGEQTMSNEQSNEHQGNSYDVDPDINNQQNPSQDLLGSELPPVYLQPTVEAMDRYADWLMENGHPFPPYWDDEYQAALALERELGNNQNSEQETTAQIDLDNPFSIPTTNIGQTSLLDIESAVINPSNTQTDLEPTKITPNIDTEGKISEQAAVPDTEEAPDHSKAAIELQNHLGSMGYDIGEFEINVNGKNAFKMGGGDIAANSMNAEIATMLHQIMHDPDNFKGEITIKVGDKVLYHQKDADVLVNTVRLNEKALNVKAITASKVLYEKAHAGVIDTSFLGTTQTAINALKTGATPEEVKTALLTHDDKIFRISKERGSEAAEEAVDKAIVEAGRAIKAEEQQTQAQTQTQEKQLAAAAGPRR